MFETLVFSYCSISKAPLRPRPPPLAEFTIHPCDFCATAVLWLVQARSCTRSLALARSHQQSGRKLLAGNAAVGRVSRHPRKDCIKGPHAPPHARVTPPLTTVPGDPPPAAGTRAPSLSDWHSPTTSASCERGVSIVGVTQASLVGSLPGAAWHCPPTSAADTRVPDASVAATAAAPPAAPLRAAAPPAKLAAGASCERGVSNVPVTEVSLVGSMPGADVAGASAAESAASAAGGNRTGDTPVTGPLVASGAAASAAAASLLELLCGAGSCSEGHARRASVRSSTLAAKAAAFGTPEMILKDRTCELEPASWADVFEVGDDCVRSPEDWPGAAESLLIA